MFENKIDVYKLQGYRIKISPTDLGKFLQGYTNERVPFNWKLLLWNLLPIAGTVMFIIFLSQYLWERQRPKRILIFENGFIKQQLTYSGQVRKYNTFKYSDLSGILYEHTRRYQNIYGIRRYITTDIKLSVLDSNNKPTKIFSGTYKNEYEIDGHYNFIGYACNAINNSWLNIAVQRFNNQLSALGYGKFITKNGEVRVNKDFISVNGEYVTSVCKYSFDNGYLYLYPNENRDSNRKHRSQSVIINISQMYNKEVFLLALNKFYGIK